MPRKTEAEIKKAQQERLQAFIFELLREEENKYCADCDSKGPRWASWNLGVFLCIRCAGIHRNLGVHLSKVKSVNLDSWTSEQVQSMRVMGNAKAKAVYEHGLPDHFRRPMSDQSLEQFIRAKYEHKRYILKDWQPPRVNVGDLPEHPVPLHPRKDANDTKSKAGKTPSNPLTVSPSGAKAAVTGGVNPVPKSEPNLVSADLQLVDFSDPAIQHPGPNAVNGSSISANPLMDDIFGPPVSVPPLAVPVGQSSISNGSTASSNLLFASTGDGSGGGVSQPPQSSLPTLSVDGTAAPPLTAASADLSQLQVDNQKKSTSDILALYGSGGGMNMMGGGSLANSAAGTPVGGQPLGGGGFPRAQSAGSNIGQTGFHQQQQQQYHQQQQNHHHQQHLSALDQANPFLNNAPPPGAFPQQLPYQQQQQTMFNMNVAGQQQQGIMMGQQQQHHYQPQQQHYQQQQQQQQVYQQQQQQPFAPSPVFSPQQQQFGNFATAQFQQSQPQQHIQQVHDPFAGLSLH